MLQEFKLDYYTVSSSNQNYYSQQSAASFNQDYLLSFVFQQAPLRYESTYIRTSFAILLANLGSILYTVRSISNGLVAGFSIFDINRSMMRKLYTTAKEGKDRDPGEPTSVLINGEDFDD